MPNENKTSDGADISDDDEHSKRIKLLDEGIEWVRIKSWANLTVDERDTANKLGYTRNKWDSGFGIRTLRETLSQCDKDGKKLHHAPCDVSSSFVRLCILTFVLLLFLYVSK